MTEQLPATIDQAEITTSLHMSHAVPALIAAAGERASLRFLEFFAANIRNPHTRRAYGRAVAEFLAWCDDQRRAVDRGRAAASRRRLDRAADARARGADRQAAAGRAPPPVRLAGDRPGGADEPGRLGARPLACR